MNLRPRKSPPRVPIAMIAAGALVYNQATSAIFGIFLAKVLGASDYGLVNLARSIFTVAIVISPFGLDLALQRHLGHVERAEFRHASEVFWMRALVLLISGFVVFTLTVGGSDFIASRFYNYANFSRVFLITFISLPLATDLAVVGGGYRGLREPTTTIVINALILPSLRMVFILALFVIVDNVTAVILGTLLSYIVSATANAVAFQRRLPVRLSALVSGFAGAREIIGYAPLLGLGTFLFILARSLDIVLLGHFQTSGDVGRYAVALTAGQTVAVIGTALGQTLGAEISGAATRGDKGRIPQLLSQIMRRASLLCAPFCAAIALWGSDVDLLLGNGYKTPQSVFILIAFAQWVTSSFNYGSWALVATGRNLLELGNNIVAIVVELFAGVYLIPRFGIVGAAASSFVMLSTLTALRQIEIAVLFERRLITIAMFGPLAVCLLIAAPIYYVQAMFSFRAWWLTGICVSFHVVLSFGALNFSLLRRRICDR